MRKKCPKMPEKERKRERKKEKREKEREREIAPILLSLIVILYSLDSLQI